MDIDFETDTEKKEFKLGGRIERLAAFMIDILIGLLSITLLGSTVIDAYFDAYSSGNLELLHNAILDKPRVYLLVLIAPTIIQAYLVTTRGQSIGKIVMSLRIVNAKDGTNPGFLKAFFVRQILPIPLIFIPEIYILYFFINPLFIFRSDRRCLHDWIGRTIVVESKIHKLLKKR